MWEDRWQPFVVLSSYVLAPGTVPADMVDSTIQILDKNHSLSTLPFSSVCDTSVNSSPLFQMAEYHVNLCTGQCRLCLTQHSGHWSVLSWGWFSLDPAWLVFSSPPFSGFSVWSLCLDRQTVVFLVPLYFLLLHDGHQWRTLEELVSWQEGATPELTSYWCLLAFCDHSCHMSDIMS